MQNISPIKERILQFIEYKGISKYRFYQETGITRGVLDKDSGISEDNIAKFIAYSDEISLDWLLKGDGDMIKRNVKEMQPFERVTKRVTFSEETKNAKNVTLLAKEEDSEHYIKMPKVVTVDKQGNDNVVLVPVKAAAGYLLGYGDPSFINTLPTFNLPNINSGTFRMFQVSGHSMYPTISDGSYVVGEWVENLIKEVKDNRIYVIISEEGILVKRVLNRLKKYGNLYLKSDNRKEYPNISLEAEQIKEVWAVKMHLSFELPDPAVLYDRVSDLEAEMEHLKQQLKK